MLLEHIKNILLSEPLDIFSEEDETLSQSSFELVTARQESDFEDYDEEDEDFEELSRYIGSANLFIAAAIVCDVTSRGKSISTLNDERDVVVANISLDSDDATVSRVKTLSSPRVLSTLRACFAIIDTVESSSPDKKHSK